MGTKRNIRTTPAERQWEYDNFLSELDPSSLAFLSWKYNDDLVYFRIHNNLNDQENAQFYKEMQQRKKMIDEEIHNRKMWEDGIDLEDE